MVSNNPHFANAENYPDVPKYLRVLMVEDDDLNRLLTQQVVKKIGWSLDTVKNGIEAVEMLRHNHYDLVLMDIQMPHSDGIEATKHIRCELKNSHGHTPIIACAHDNDNLNSWLDAGMNDHIAKPFSSAQLIAKVSELIKKSADQVRKQEPPATKDNDDLNDDSVINLNNLLNFSGNDIDTIRSIVEVFLEQAPDQLTLLTSLMSQKDWNAVKILCHKTKSSYAIIGANSVRSILQTIEDDCVQNRIDEVKFKELLDKTFALNEVVVKRIRAIAGL